MTRGDAFSRRMGKPQSGEVRAAIRMPTSVKLGTFLCDLNSLRCQRQGRENAIIPVLTSSRLAMPASVRAKGRASRDRAP